MKTIDIKPTYSKMPKDYLGDLGRGFIVQRGSLFYGIYISLKLIPFTEKVLFVTMFGDKLREGYPNTSFKKFDNPSLSKHIKELINKYES